MRKITKTKFLILFFLFFAFTFANAAKGPQYRSLRVHGMGGAFIAVADGKEALYYNPAGLNLKKRFENFEVYPDMGYMPRQRYEFRLLTASVGLPEDQINHVLSTCGMNKIGTMVKNLLFINLGYFRKIELCKEYSDVKDRLDDGESIFDIVQDNQDAYEKLNRLDGDPLEIGAQVSVFEFSMHNFGFATWANTSFAPYINTGILLPEGLGFEPIYIDIVAQTAIAFSPVNDWSVGLGLKMARRYIHPKYHYEANVKHNGDNFETDFSTDELQKKLEDFKEDIKKDIDKNPFTSSNYALDFGLLYQLNREVRLGTSLRNVFFSELAGESITPNLSIGAAYSPMILQSNSWWARKVNFAADYVDMLDGTVTDMFFAHSRLGVEAEQIVLPSLTRDFSFWPRFGFGILGGVLGYVAGRYIIGGLIDGYDMDSSIPLLGSTTGSIAGAVIGTVAGLNIGFGGDVLRTSLGLGMEGGYPAWGIGIALSDAVVTRFGSYAEEKGLRTGQKKQRFYTLEFSVGF